MSSSKHPTASNDNSDKDRAIIKPSQGTCGILPDTDKDVVTVDEELAEDQEMEDSYVFVEADYHSYSDVASSVTEGSRSDCELSEREEEGDVDSKNGAHKTEAQNGGVKKGCVKKATEKKTSGVEGSGGNDNGEDLPHMVKLLMRIDHIVTIPTLDLRD
ncbi:hypothetical protein J4E85_007161 [Alternaria conjuncta]|uniref:uncharacterized protein n=1 Tax=Alternaria conjuncta TaxID=181017 RepID=UPI00222088C9|nr:uncharacterized protein J4E85_007161 [Alternaria conjuncta]KAI4925283.1 hypothetical protein J4E85_007161 [Alternaria conjuncta]